MIVLPAFRHPLQSVNRFSHPSSILSGFDIDVAADHLGLRLVRIGTKSPLRGLANHEHLLVGVVEVGDLIVAINGQAVREIQDLHTHLAEATRREITIFDHRTRRKVVWNLGAVHGLVNGNATGPI